MSIYLERVTAGEVESYWNTRGLVYFPNGCASNPMLGTRIQNIMSIISSLTEIDQDTRRDELVRLWRERLALGNHPHTFCPDLQMVMNAGDEVGMPRFQFDAEPSEETLANFDANLTQHLSSSRFGRRKSVVSNRLEESFSECEDYVRNLMALLGWLQIVTFRLTIPTISDASQLNTLANRLFRQMNLAGHVTFLHFNGSFFDLWVVGLLGPASITTAIPQMWFQLTGNTGGVFIDDPLMIGGFTVSQGDLSRLDWLLSRFAIAYKADSIMRFRPKNAMKTIKIGPLPSFHQPNAIGCNFIQQALCR